MFIKYLAVLILSVGLISTAMAAGSSSTSNQRNDTDYETAVQAVKAANYEKAVMLLSRVVAAKPNNADAWNYLGFSKRKLLQFDQALNAYQKALAINPDHRGANEWYCQLNGTVSNCAIIC